jgi:hypothetical protein
MADENQAITFEFKPAIPPNKTEFTNCTWIESEGQDTVSYADEDGEVAQRKLAPKPTEDGFASQWHRDTYVNNLRRELAGIEHRRTTLQPRPGNVLDELSHPKTMAELDAYEKDVLAELKRLGEKP